MIALSFSGGKDSCLSLYYLQKQGTHVACLFTTVWKEDGRTVAHHESLHVLQKQATRLGIPIYFIYTTFDTYREDLITMLKKLKETHSITGVAFGDWYIEGHREWNEACAEEVDLKAHFPLWNPEADLEQELERFLSLGFQATIVKVDEEKLSKKWVGRTLDRFFIDELRKDPSLCPMGEHGEYHTTVTDGPIFLEK